MPGRTYCWVNHCVWWKRCLPVPMLQKQAERVLEKLLDQVHSGAHHLSDASVAEMMAAYLDDETVKLGRKARATNKGYHRKHIEPLPHRFKINGTTSIPRCTTSSSPSSGGAGLTAGPAAARRRSGIGPIVRAVRSRRRSRTQR
jgi:hypothetical protein